MATYTPVIYALAARADGVSAPELAAAVPGLRITLARQSLCHAVGNGWLLKVGNDRPARYKLASGYALDGITVRRAVKRTAPNLAPGISQRQALRDHMRAHGPTTCREAADMLGVAPNVAARALGNMVLAGEVERAHGTKGLQYPLTDGSRAVPAPVVIAPRQLSGDYTWPARAQVQRGAAPGLQSRFEPGPGWVPGPGSFSAEWRRLRGQA